MPELEIMTVVIENTKKCKHNKLLVRSRSVILYGKKTIHSDNATHALSIFLADHLSKPLSNH